MSHCIVIYIVAHSNDLKDVSVKIFLKFLITCAEVIRLLCLITLKELYSQQLVLSMLCSRLHNQVRRILGNVGPLPAFDCRPQSIDEELRVDSLSNRHRFNLFQDDVSLILEVELYLLKYNFTVSFRQFLEAILESVEESEGQRAVKIGKIEINLVISWIQNLMLYGKSNCYLEESNTYLTQSGMLVIKNLDHQRNREIEQVQIHSLRQYSANKRLLSLLALVVDLVHVAKIVLPHKVPFERRKRLHLFLVFNSTKLNI